MATKAGASAARKFWIRVIGAALLGVALAAGLARTDWGRSLENIYYDYWHILSEVRHPVKHVAFVEVDDKTLDSLKEDPLAFWAPYFGEAMNVLTEVGTKAVGLDFIYQVSAEDWLKKLNLPESEISRTMTHRSGRLLPPETRYSSPR